MGSKLGSHPACPPCSPRPCWFLRQQCPLSSPAQATWCPRPALPTKFGVASALGHPCVGELEQAGAFATFGNWAPVPQGASAWQLYEQATNLLEGSAEICRLYSLLMTCK